MYQHNLYIAVIGALSKFKGFGDNIASSKAFSKDLNNVRAIAEIDKSFSSFYDSYPDVYHSLFQYFAFPKTIANNGCFLIIRGRKKFTAFPEQNRFYDRREYFYCNLKSEIDSIDFLFSIPDIAQYETEQLGQINEFEIKRANYLTDDSFTRSIVFSLLNEGTLAIKISEQNHSDIQSKILGSLNSLPPCYKKYLGFGFNIKSDSAFVKNHLHILTTLDENAIEIGSLLPHRLHDNDLNEFSEGILNNSIKYDDTELELLNVTPNRNTLFALVKYHKLHFRIEKYSNSSLEEKKKQDLFSESKNYIATFLTNAFADNSYIQKRIISIYKFWNNGNFLKADTFLSFWKKVGEANLKHERFFNDYEVRESINTFIQIEFRSVKSLSDAENRYSTLSEVPSFNYTGVSLLDEIKIEFYTQKKTDSTLSIAEINELDIYIKAIARSTKIDFQENLLRNVDFKKQASSLSSEEGFELLKEKIEELSSNQIEEIITAIGLTNLFQFLKNGSHQKLLRNIDFNMPLLELAIKQGNFNEILKWVSLLHSNNVKPNFNTSSYLTDQSKKINSQNEFLLFDSLCKSISNNKSLFKEDDVLSFIEKIVLKSNCQQMQFYSAAFPVAESFKFKINCPIPSSNTEEELMDFISLFGQNQNLVTNKKIVEELKEEFFNLFLQHKYSFGEVLRFSNENILFVSANTNQFSRKLEEIFSNGDDSEMYQNTLILFNNIIDNERNLFLNSNSNLYKSISELVISDKGSIKELYRIGEKIDKKRNTEFTEVKSLINQKINKYFESINLNAKFFTKMKNRISFINRNTKILCACLVLALVVTIIGAGYFFTQYSILSVTFEKKSQENTSLKTENQKLQTELLSTIKEINNNPINIPTPLSPIPNRELNLNDVGIVNSNIQIGMSIEEVVAVIFKKNPEDINSHYSSQKNAYVVALAKTNVKCFDNGQYTGEPLIHIPSYK